MPGDIWSGIKTDVRNKMGWFAIERVKGGMPKRNPEIAAMKKLEKAAIINDIKGRLGTPNVYNENLTLLANNINKLKEYISSNDSLKPDRAKLFNILLEKDEKKVIDMFKKVRLPSLHGEYRAAKQNIIKQEQEKKITEIDKTTKEFIDKLYNIVNLSRLADTDEKKISVRTRAEELLRLISELSEKAREFGDNKILEPLTGIILALRELIGALALSEEVSFESKTSEEKTKIIRQCPQVFDPCTGQKLPKTNSTLKIIDKRIAFLRINIRRNILGDVYGLNNESTNDIFLKNIFLDKTITLEQMILIKLVEGSNIGVDVFETLSRLFVFFGGVRADTDNKEINPRNGGEYKFMDKLKISKGYEPTLYISAIEGLQDTLCKGVSAAGVSDVTITRQSTDSLEGNNYNLTPTTPYANLTDKSANEQYTLSKKKVYGSSSKWYEHTKELINNYDLTTLNPLLFDDRLPIPHTLAGHADINNRNEVGLLLFIKSKQEFYNKYDFNPDTRTKYKKYWDMCNPPYGNIYNWEHIRNFLDKIRTDIFMKAECEGISPQEAFLKEYDTFNPFILGKDNVGLNTTNYQFVIDPPLSNTE
jgi:hypothetical protein